MFSVKLAGRATCLCFTPQEKEDLAHRWIKKGRPILRDDAIRNANFRRSLIRHFVLGFAKKLSIECADQQGS
jgi:hypothetical protein